MADILMERDADGVVTLTLNRPDSLNAFSFSMYDEFIAILEGLQNDPRARAVILTGAGRAFSAGHDLKSGGKPNWVDQELGRAYSQKLTMNRLARIPLLMRQVPQPIIAAVNGAAAGIGLAFAVAADLCIAGKSAKFVNSLHNAGTGHEVGLSWMLPRAVGTQRAAEILLTGRAVLAEEAAAIGLALRAVPDDQLLAEARKIAAGIVANVPIGVWVTKQSLWLNQGIGSLEAATEIEARAVFQAQATEDKNEKRSSFLEKRSPKFNFR